MELTINILMLDYFREMRIKNEIELSNLRKNGVFSGWKIFRFNFYKILPFDFLIWFKDDTEQMSCFKKYRYCKMLTNEINQFIWQNEAFVSYLLKLTGDKELIIKPKLFIGKAKIDKSKSGRDKFLPTERKPIGKRYALPDRLEIYLNNNDQDGRALTKAWKIASTYDWVHNLGVFNDLIMDLKTTMEQSRSEVLYTVDYSNQESLNQDENFEQLRYTACEIRSIIEKLCQKGCIEKSDQNLFFKYVTDPLARLSIKKNKIHWTHKKGTLAATARKIFNEDVFFCAEFNKIFHEQTLSGNITPNAVAFIEDCFPDYKPKKHKEIIYKKSIL